MSRGAPGATAGAVSTHTATAATPAAIRITAHNRAERGISLLSGISLLKDISLLAVRPQAVLATSMPTAGPRTQRSGTQPA
ncbi:hypothetical protein GCM10010176_085050 [Nonomuraea spiralis]|nr:hypothetical protein GCM10010176_085050 [Nonomuraea spiralis]